MESKIGNVYSYVREETMLKVAKELEVEGYQVHKYQEDFFGRPRYRVRIIGYKNGDR